MFKSRDGDLPGNGQHVGLWFFLPAPPFLSGVPAFNLTRIPLPGNFILFIINLAFFVCFPHSSLLLNGFEHFKCFQPDSDLRNSVRF